MTTQRGDAVMLVAHGTIASLDELPAFLAEIRRGRPAPPELIEELKHRYTQIGGSPLLRLTRQQAQALSDELDIPVLVAMRLWQPRVEQVLKEHQADGFRRVCVLPLAPYSVHVYNAAAQAAFETAAAELGSVPSPLFVENWGLAGEFLEAHVAALTEALERAPRDAAVVLSAHSLPRMVVERGDPYAQLVSDAVEEIARRLGRSVTLAYQSQGADATPWLGPTLLEVFERLRGQGVSSVVLSPFGFLADHVETLYDVDIEARAQAEGLGLGFVRVRTLNTDPRLISAMASVVRRAFD